MPKIKVGNEIEHHSDLFRFEGEGRPLQKKHGGGWCGFYWDDEGCSLSTANTLSAYVVGIKVSSEIMKMSSWLKKNLFESNKGDQRITVE